ncbi:MAG: cell envelope integrity protein CreD [Bacteroidetes bacterium]|nr:cell envelope integrity protein CreD [Bacteroidota bacterium]
MKNKYSSVGIAFRIWILTAVILASGSLIVALFGGEFSLVMILLLFIGAVTGSAPAFAALCFLIPLINRTASSFKTKFLGLILIEFAITLLYGIAGIILEFSAELFWSGHFVKQIHTAAMITGVLFGCTTTASLLLLQKIAGYFSDGDLLRLNRLQLFQSFFYHTNTNATTMESFETVQQQLPQTENQSNKLLIKGVITGVLILLMLIPTVFISNIITEREQRQKEAVTEVSSKWSKAQTVSAPYLVVPYTDTIVNTEGKIVSTKKQLILLANNLDVKGTILPEQRPRSIYKVLLYKTNIQLNGSFKPKWPQDINTATLDFQNARLCFGISDFKGIEEEMHIQFNQQQLALSPGLPLNDINEIGLSVPVSLTLDAMNNGIPFSMELKLKGSEQLHFNPLSANSTFSLASPWPNPSFDGNILPNERSVNANGFMAKWNFNQANLPFGTVLKQGTFSAASLSFGVTMVQPADQYDKTMRSVKYAILFIGLTFALFFIVEIMQRKAFHPVQYVLVGLALVIFYTLLLSISEYISFDYAYLLASLATVLLISLYAKSHFASWRTAGVFFSTLGLLYGFIFVLIRLEDTALLVGSIGLFTVLAMVMYASRKVQWYGKNIEIAG